VHMLAFCQVNALNEYDDDDEKVLCTSVKQCFKISYKKKQKFLAILPAMDKLRQNKK